MQIQETFDFAEFAARYESDWRETAAASSLATVFQTWEWTSTWWRFYRGSRRWWGLAFLEEGSVVGLAALTLPLLASPLRTVRFAGTGGSDYLDLLARPGQEACVADALARFLVEKKGRWDWLDLQQVRPTSVATLLSSPSTEMPTQIRVGAWRGETCPFTPLAPDWDAFKRGLGKKLRQNIGYYARALEKQYVVEWRIATEETLDVDMEDFFDLHQQRWNQRWLPGAFAGRRARAFHKETARLLLGAGMLRLHTLSLDGEVRAALYCFQKGDRCYYYLGGFDPALARLSIGTTLTAHAIRHAIEQDNATEFDFLRGNEAYKYRWGAKDRYNLRLSVTRHLDPRSALLAAGGKVELKTEQWFKEWMHRRHGGAGGASHEPDKER